MYYVAIGLVIIVFIWRIIAGFKKGMVGEIISLISMVVALISLYVVLQIINSYMNDNFSNIIKMAIILIFIGLVYKVANLIFTSLKLIAKLPVISSLNRLLGALVGAVEAVIIILILIQVLRFFSYPIPPPV